MIAMTLAVLCGTALAVYEFNTTSSMVHAARTTDSVSQKASRPEPADNVRPDNSSRQQALNDCITALESVQKRLEGLNDYAATFMIRERIDGELTDKQEVALHVRHKPFSVRMKWTGEGREVVFIKGRNDDQLIVKPGGLASLIGTLELDPEGDTAMAKSRYPITEAGMLALVEKLLEYQKPMLKDSTGVKCVRSIERCEGHDCDCFVITYRDANVCDGYAKTRLHVDRKSGLLVSIENDRFESSTNSKSTLVEHYVFKDVKPDVGFTDEDFKLAQSGLSGRLKTAVAQRNVAR